jgi:hypothetical protein
MSETDYRLTTRNIVEGGREAGLNIYFVRYLFMYRTDSCAV